MPFNFQYIVTVSLLLIPLIANAAMRPENVVVFGDSLSDPGNFFAIKQVDSDSELGQQDTPPFEPDNVPNAPYAWGGHHFTNGDTWIEQLTQSMRLPKSGMPAWAKSGKFSNYAVGRSRARTLEDDPVPLGVFNEVTFSAQVEKYLADTGGQASPETLYVIWVGSNDLGDAILLGLQLANLNVPSAQIQQMQSSMLESSLGNIIQRMLELYTAGTRKFLILTLPDFSILPFVNLAVQVNVPEPFRDVVLGTISQATQNYNLGLELSLDGFQATLNDPELSIVTFDTFSAMNDLAANPELYGLEEIAQPCITPGVQGQALCAEPDTYMFVDGIHPTRRVHQILADQVEASLNN